MEAVSIGSDTQHDLSWRISLLWVRWQANFVEPTWSAGNPALVHALTADAADPARSAVGAHASSKGALGPTVVDHGPHTS
jgi:hypothetical protein